MESPQKPAHPFPASGRARRLALVVAIIAGLCTVSQASAFAAGNVDSSFGVNGKKDFPALVAESTSEVAEFAIDSAFRIVSALKVNVTAGTPQMVVSRHLPDGSIDGDFGPTNGHTDPIDRVITGSLAIQGDGKILVVGKDSREWMNQIVLARFTNSGVLDPSFGLNGVMRLAAQSDRYWSDENPKVFVQSNQRIVIAMQSFHMQEVNDFLEFRGLLSNGSVDSAFGAEGTFSFSFEFWNDHEIASLVMTSDDKIVGVGAKGMVRGQIFRLTSEGRIDSSFGADGILAIEPEPGQFSRVTTVAVKTDGKIIVGGIYQAATDGDWNLFTGAITPNGAIDTSYGTEGFTKTSFVSNDGSFNSMFLQSDGSAVFATSPGLTENQHIVLRRFTPVGIFSVAFTVTTSDGAKANATQIKYLNTGQFILAGSATSLAGRSMLLLKFNNLGAFDPMGLDTIDAVTNFSPLMFSLNVQTFSIRQLVPLASGNLIGVGSLDDYSRGQSRPTLIRLLPNGSVDQTFGSNTGTTGYLVIGPIAANIREQQIIVMNDDKILVLTTYSQWAGPHPFTIVKLNSDGTPDESFGSGNGITQVTSPLKIEAIKMMLTRSGKIVIVGNMKMTDQTWRPFIKRLNSDGSNDDAFAESGHLLLPNSEGQSIIDAEIDHNDRIVLVGSAGSQGLVTRVNANGVSDRMRIIDKPDSVDGMWFAEINFLPSGNILIVGGTDGDQNLRSKVLLKLNDDFSFDSSFTGEDGSARGLVFYQNPSYAITQTIIANPDSFTILYSVTDDFEGSSSLEEYLNNGAHDVSTAANGILDTSLSVHFKGVSAVLSSSTSLFIAGNYFDDSIGNVGSIIKVDRSSVTPTPVPPPTIVDAGNNQQTSTVPMTVQTSVTTTISTTILPIQSTVAKKRVQPKLTRKKYVTAASVAKYIDLKVPKGAKLVMTSQTSTQKVCAMRTARLWGLKPGTCRVNLTMTAKGKKPVKKVVKLLVTK
jgi:uncharacterized delta-60 repeat protein